jgi:TPR repeat protein
LKTIRKINFNGFIIMNFKQRYQTLLAEKSANVAGLSLQAAETLKNPNLSAEQWYESMALCEAALDANILDDNIKKLFKEMYRHSRDHHAGKVLNDEDYAQWFEQATGICKKFIAAGHMGAWAELGDMYEHARGSLRNIDAAREALNNGVAAEDPVALSVYGYYMFYGVSEMYPVDKEKGREYIIRGHKKGYDLGDIYLLNIDYDSDKDNDTYIAEIKAYMDSCTSELNKPWSLLGNVYAGRVGDMEKAMEYYEKGIAVHDPYCKYMTGYNILNRRAEGDSARAVGLLEEAFDYLILYAGYFLGQYYQYNEDAQSTEKAIEWYTKTAEYHHSPSMLNLAMIYIYNNGEYKNLSEGMKWLDLAIEENNARAMSEKAYILLEHDDLEHDVPKAKELLERASELGDDYAPYRLARGYQNAEFGEEHDYQKAFELYKLAVERNYIYAIEMLGRYYRAGIVSEPDPEKAIEYYNRAIEHNSDYARVELALCYEEGFGVEHDDHKAFELLKQAAENGYTYADIKLGYYYINGIVGEPDNDKAFEHFNAAAEKGHPDGLYNVGRIYKYAIGRPENPELALEYFHKAVDAGDMDAHIELALCYEHEYGGLDFDPDRAMHYMEIAAGNNWAYAQYKMGCYYYYGMKEQDIERGMEYLRRAYGNGSALAALVIGDHHLYAREEGLDYRDAYPYYKFAEEHGCVSEGIGLCYKYGIGIEENEAEAFKSFSIAADGGYTSAKYNLGLCYMHGTGTPVSLSEAYRWMLQAATEGNRNAEYELGVMLLEGKGTPKDAEKGVEWLLKAAENEQDDAQLKLGNCYLVGEGVPEDEVQAMYWYQKAAENGNEQALKITGKRSKRR